MGVEVVGEVPIAALLAQFTDDVEANAAAITAAEAALAAEIDARQEADAERIPTSEKGAPGGVATLDPITGKLLAEQAPAGGGAVASVNGRAGAVVGLAEAADLADLSDELDTTAANLQAQIDLRQTLAQKNVANGYIGANAQVEVDVSRIPAAIARDAEVTAAIGAAETAITAAYQAAIDQAVANLLESAPGALATLNDLAAAIGDDPNFAASITNALAGKQAAHANLTALAGLVIAADKLPYGSADGTLSLTNFTAFARTLVATVSAAEARTAMGLGTAATANVGAFEAAGAANAAQIAAIAAAQALVDTEVAARALADSKYEAINVYVNDHTFDAADLRDLNVANKATAIKFLVPTDATWDAPIGTTLFFRNKGAGQLAIEAVTPGTTTIVSSGATIASPKTRILHAAGSVTKEAANYWSVSGDIA